MKHALLLAALAALPALGCSVIVGGSVNDTCTTTDDCKNLGFANATCDAKKGQCVPQGTGGTGGGGGNCEVNADCNKVKDDPPAICRADKTCAQLTSQDCTQVLGNYQDPNAIILGFLGPLVGADQSTGVPIHNGAKLALHEIEQNVVGLPGGPNGKPRPIAMVCCDDLSGPAEDPYRAAEHLVNDVQVPAILGPAFSGVTINVAKNVTIPAGVLLISASATSPLITDLADNSLVWRTCPSDAIQAIPLAGLVGPLETQIRAEQSLTMADQIRVAMAVKGDAYGTGLANAVTPLLSFNDNKNATQNGENFIRVDYDDPAGNPMPDFSTQISKIIKLKPNIVLLFGTTEAAKDMFTGIEKAWASINPPAPRPYYLLPDGGKVPELTTAIGADDSLRKRVRGTVPGVQSPLYGPFKFRYNGYIGTDPLAYSDTGYDAAYLLAYSILTLGSKPITGAGISDGLKHMSKGMGTDAGPDALNKAFDAIQAAGEIDYSGASGPLNFDPKTGEAKADIDIWCIGRNGAKEAIFVSSGEHFDATQNMIVGSYNDMGQCN